jgi:pyrroloquinoline quinone biosynthesis protein B
LNQPLGQRTIAGLILLMAMSSVVATEVWLVVLGVAQDGGVPQLGHDTHPAWEKPELQRSATSLALVDEAGKQRWLFDASPDLRRQLHQLHRRFPAINGLAGIFLTHAHMGHYTGLMFLGHESMGARSVPVHAMPRMMQYLSSNGPWDQLVRYDNITLKPMEAGHAVQLGQSIQVTPILVPHRQEYSEVVAFRIQGPNRAALFLPDIDRWSDWDAQGIRLEDQLRSVDIAFLDGTFFADGEIAGRDMSGFPHPRIQATLARLAPLPASERAKVHFIHLNHSNPALVADSPEAARVAQAGFKIASEGQLVPL